MKKNRILILVVMILQTLNIAAYDCKVDGICYNLDLQKMTASVSEGNHDIAGNGCLKIPSTFNFKGHIFKVTSVGRHAFEDKVDLKSIDLGNNITVIEAWAFQRCKNLKSINLEYVDKIEGYAFCDCSSLEKINIKNVSIIHLGAFDRCSKLTSIEIGSVKNLSDLVFGHCYSLTSLKINSVDKIEAWAFSYCPNLTHIEIINVNMIDYDAFEQTTNLKTLILHNITPPKVSGNPFPKLALFATLKVPFESIETYKKAPFWNKFLTIDKCE